jgi:hypothetical protein
VISYSPKKPRAEYSPRALLLELDQSRFVAFPATPAQRRFFLRNSKLLFTSQMWTHRVFQSVELDLELDLSLPKYQQAYSRCLNIEQLTA